METIDVDLAPEVPSGLVAAAERTKSSVTKLLQLLTLIDVRRQMFEVPGQEILREILAFGRREEAAATRSLLNTAKFMEDNLTLIRLKELETLDTPDGKGRNHKRTWRIRRFARQTVAAVNIF